MSISEMHKSALSLVWQAILRHRSVFRDALAATLVVNTLTLASSLFAMQVYDRVIPRSGFQTLYVLAFGVSLAVLLELLLRHLRSVILDRATTRIDIELSDWFFQRAMAIRMESRPPSLGTFASQIRGLEFLRGVLGSATMFVLADLPFALFFILVIAMLGGLLAVVPLVLLPLALFAGLFFQRRINLATAASQGHSNKKAGMLVESIDGIESIKANGSERQVQVRWRSLLEEAGIDDDRIKYCSGLSGNMTNALQQLGYVALISLGAWLVVEGRMTMGGLIACSIISSRALAPIGRIPGILVQWAQCRSAMANLDKLLALPNEQEHGEELLNPGLVQGGFQMEGITFYYNETDRPALELPNLLVLPGERIGVIGAIGSGKSTLLKLASGLYRPREGRMFLDGLDCAMIDPERLRRVIGYVPQDIRLICGTLRENLLQGIDDPGDEAIVAAARETGLLELINSHPKGFSLPISEGGRGISGGQRQLIGITRLLLTDPSLVLLDEPTASMDAVTEARVVALLQKKVAQGATLLVATHKTAVLPILERLLVFKGGRLLMDGPRDKVLTALSRKTSDEQPENEVKVA